MDRNFRNRYEVFTHTKDKKKNTKSLHKGKARHIHGINIIVPPYPLSYHVPESPIKAKEKSFSCSDDTYCFIHLILDIAHCRSCLQYNTPTTLLVLCKHKRYCSFNGKFVVSHSKLYLLKGSCTCASFFSCRPHRRLSLEDQRRIRVFVSRVECRADYWDRLQRPY